MMIKYMRKKILITFRLSKHITSEAHHNEFFSNVWIIYSIEVSF